MIENSQIELKPAAYSHASATNNPTNIVTLIDSPIDEIESFLQQYQLNFTLVKNHETITGSFWGDSEAGLIKNTLFARYDTPLHSIFHETCHYICMDKNRRAELDTNAKGTYSEENAVCYMQILLADEISIMNKERMMQDMDSWGYTFRLGSTKAWFENDAEDALAWLQDEGLLDNKNKPNFTLRT